MRSSRMLLVAALVGTLTLLGGCKRLFAGGNCNKPQAYAGAEDLPRLKVPLGLDGLDTRAALRIPELTEPEPPRSPGDPCLEEPPSVRDAAPRAR
jgi:hypothetical protein